MHGHAHISHDYIHEVYVIEINKKYADYVIFQDVTVKDYDLSPFPKCYVIIFLKVLQGI